MANGGASARRAFRLVCADLPGYGASPIRTATGVESYSKRAAAERLIRAMHALGHSHFAVVGHDRGGRVAYRMALDHPTVITRTAVLDVVPTAEVWQRADDRFALAYWPWLLLAQPAPLPERILVGAADAIVDHALDAWGPSGHSVPSWVRRSYVDALRDPGSAHAICEEYRAAAAVDVDHDRADMANRVRIQHDVLAMWAEHGPLDTWYRDEGGPLGIRRSWAADLRGHAVPGGHFFPETQPKQTIDTLDEFLRADLR